MGIYIHIPFCGSKCSYCAFYSVASPVLKAPYVEALIKEIEMRKDYIKGEHNTFYVGGGTPSQLSPNEWKMIIEKVRSTFKFSQDAEWTLEVNPEDVTPGLASLWRELGFNRVSVGVQSLNDEQLKAVRRRHSRQGALDCFRYLREAGFEHISADLIIGLPSSTEESERESIDLILEQGVEHVSVYILSIDEKTELEWLVKKGQFKEFDDELLIERFNKIVQLIEERGFEHYEISNFAKTGARSRHNSSYWQGVPYLGLGAGAHSFNGHERHWGYDHIKKYIDTIDEGKTPVDSEILTVEDRYNEAIMTSLRMSDGLAHRRMFELNENQWKRSQSYRNQLVESGCAKDDGTHFALTKKGWLISDEIFRELFI